MAPDLLVPAAMFCFVSSITPGPNNMMLMSSGLTFGWRATLPHMMGVALGFVVMVFGVGLGLGALFEAVPQLYTGLKVISVIYLLWLAWKIANSGPVGDGTVVAGKPMTFLQAAAFQWVNPKAWVMAVTAIAAYAPKQGFFGNVVFISLLFGLINLPCIATWVVFGNLLRQYLRDARTVRWINLGMALALVASLWPLLSEFMKG